MKHKYQISIHSGGTGIEAESPEDALDILLQEYVFGERKVSAAILEEPNRDELPIAPEDIKTGIYLAEIQIEGVEDYRVSVTKKELNDKT